MLFTRDYWAYITHLLSGCCVWVLMRFPQERGVDLEIVRATVLYRLRSNFLAVDTTVACAQSWYQYDVV